jgi:hypothetical protein
MRPQEAIDLFCEEKGEKNGLSQDFWILYMYNQLGKQDLYQPLKYLKLYSKKPMQEVLEYHSGHLFQTSSAFG